MKLKENPIVYLGEKLWKYSEGNRRMVVLYLVMTWLSNLAHLCIPLIVVLLSNELQTNGVTEGNFYYLLFLSSLFIVRNLVGWSLHGPSRIIEERNGFKNRADYKFGLLRGVAGLPISWHNEHHSGDTGDKIEKGGNGLSGFASNTFRVVIVANSMVVSFFILLFFDPGAGFIALFMMALTIFVIERFDRKLVEYYRILNRAENKIHEKIMDVIANINTVKILGIEKLLLSSVHDEMWKPFKLFKKTNVTNEFKWFFASLCTNIMVFLILAYHFWGRLYWELPILLGTFYALYGYAMQVADCFFELAGFYGDVLRWRAGVTNSEELASEFKPQKNGNNGNNKYQNWKNLKIESLNFSYHTKDGADLHLEDVWFEATRGEKIALIGYTGSGKSTLLAIIKQLFEPQGSRFYLDFKLIKEGLAAIKSQVALVPQDPDIFAKSIYENISFGDYDMETVKKYADMACFTDVAEKLPKSWDSIINERGVNLSGGEKQRLALARGLLFACEDKLEPKSIVLLDEPTSSVDVSTELQIHKNIFKALSGKTIISSVHRLHLLPMFDRIYFFENGRVIAIGTFDELLKNSNEFSAIWSKYNSVLSKAAE